MDEDREVGDPVCWLDGLCPECRAMPTGEAPAVCWRCGTPLDPRPAGGDPA
jgi:predicted amidophosphoribosyltransferase